MDTYTVTAGDDAAIDLNPSSTAAEVVRNVLMILSTPQGAVPMARDFGLDMSFMDKPINIGIPLMVAAVKEAITKYEPRAEIIDINYEVDKESPGRIVPVVEVGINE